MKSTDILHSKENLEILSKIEPEFQCYYKRFLGLTEVDHPSFGCGEITQVVKSWCDQMGAETEIDEHNNLVARIPANGMPENSPVVSIQTHLDMVWVGEKIDGKIKVELQEKDGKRILVAPHSTLGADDGFGVALCLEVIENAKNFIHGPMELIMTSDEEVGLIGIKKFPPANTTEKTSITPFKFKYLLNCDSLCGDKIYVGSSGGIMYRSETDLHLEELKTSKKGLTIDLSKFSGGHSGATIQRGQGNPIKWVSQILSALEKNDIDYEIVTFNGGHAINAIPTHCKCTVAIEAEKIELATKIANEALNDLIDAFKLVEHDIKCGISTESIDSGKKVINSYESHQLIYLIQAAHHGIVRFHPQFPTTVDTSLNLALASFDSEKSKFHIHLFSRSATQAELDNVDYTVKSLFNMSPLKPVFRTQLAGHPWSPRESKVAKIVQETAKGIIGDMPLGILQVTVEPAEFLFLGYDADMVSICPSLPKAHCIGEWMDIDEANRWRDVILKVLPQLTE